MTYNTLATARSITDLQITKSYQDSVSPSDPLNYYQFQFGSRSSLNLSVNGLGADVNLEVIQDANRNGVVDSSEIIASSTNSGLLAEMLNLTLDKGTYYIRVSSANGGSTAYSLNVTASGSSPDVLWRSYGSGQNAVWSLNGTSIASSAFLLNVSDLNWQLEGTNDFNNDGQADLVWRNYSTGQNAIWYINGTSIASSTFLLTVTDRNWKIEGTGDFNNDGQVDLVWRNYSTGQNAIWYMNGTSIASSAFLLTVADSNWKIEGTGDFNNDGQVDLLWRDYRTGQNAIWYMNRGAFSSSAFLLTVADSNWKIEGTGDFNNDGQVDLLWRSYSTGQNAIWYMNGTSIASSAFLLTVADSSWKIAGVIQRSNTASPSDGVGNARTTALNIGTLFGNGTYRDSLSASDTEDYYKFFLAEGNTVNLALNSLSGNANMRLLTSDGTVVQTSNNPGTNAESINRQLDPGTYYVQIYSDPSSGVVNYSLSISGVPTTINSSLYWTRQQGSLGKDVSNDIAVDSLGNVYIVGFTTGSLGAANAGDSDAFISKYNSSGVLQWTKQLGGVGTDSFDGVAIDSSGNVFAGGWTANGQVSGNLRSWLVKFNSDGNTQWSTQVGSGRSIRDIEFDRNGDIIAGTGLSIYRFNSNGNMLSVFSLPDLGWMDIDSSGNIFVGGYTQKTIGANNAGDYDIWLAKYNSTGTQQWIRQFGSAKIDWLFGTAVDRAGNVYITGRTTGSLAANNPDEDYDVWIAKYDTNGNRLWIKQSANFGFDSANDIVLDSAGNVFIAETAASYSPYRLNSYITKYSPDGTQQWRKQLTSAAGELLRADSTGIEIDTSGNLYVTGFTSASLEGNFAGGEYDAWVIKYQVEQSSGRVFNSTYGYGLVDAAAAVAKALGLPIFGDVADIGGNNWNNDLINSPEVWARGYTGQGVTVAVIDSGVDITHSDLAGNIWRNTREIANNGIDDDGNGYIDDVNGWNFSARNNNVTPGSMSVSRNGHGTHVAGTIAALNNGVGITGVAPNAKIMAIKMGEVDPAGYFSNFGDLAAAIRYAVDNGARVINMSIGTSDNLALKDAIAYAASRGAITVSSAGNASAPTPGYPAAYANQFGIAVGAVDSTRTIAGFSNRAGSDSAMQFVVAPGVGVYSTLPGNSYAFWNGTSMAAPNVAGVVALMLSANPNLTPAQVIQIITNSTIGLNFSSQTALSSGVLVDIAL